LKTEVGTVGRLRVALAVLDHVRGVVDDDVEKDSDTFVTARFH